MALDTSEVLDLSKENIQPLRQGRKASHLKTALQAQINPETQQMLHRKREEYEYMIRMYEGNDPLEPYYNYVIWLEQSFPKMGRENNVIQLLEDTLIKFKDCEKYKQDRRLIQLLNKYLGVQANPLELYRLVYDQGLGTMCASLYKAWAEEFDKVNDIKGADEIYKLGIQCRAQPLEELQNAHVQFQLSVARRMIDGTLNPAASAESSRSVLSKLKPSNVKTNRVSRDSAGVMTSRKSEARLTNANFVVPKFQIYEEDGQNLPQKSNVKKENKFPKGSVSDRENIMQAGKWCGQKQRQSYRMSVIPSTPSFQIHEDPEAACSNMKTDFRPRALKIRRDDFNPPIAVFEPPDPTKKPMYPKQLVYVGGRDVQLEEIRAAHYWKNLEQNSYDGDEDTVPEPETKDDVGTTPEVARNSDKFTELSLPPAAQTKSANWFSSFHHSPSTSITVNTRAAMNIIQQMWESPLSEDAEKVGTCFDRLSEKPAFPVYSSAPSIPQDPSSFPVFCDENEPKSSNPFQVYVDDSMIPIEKQSRSCPPPPNTQIKPLTTCTKPTFEIFCDENASKRNEDPLDFNFKTPSSAVPKTPRNPFVCSLEDVGCFPLDNRTPASLPVSGDQFIPVFRSNETSEKHCVKIGSKNFCVNADDEDEELARPMGSLNMNNENRVSVNAATTPLPLIIPVNLFDTPLEPENKENQPPKDYASPNERRPLSGILTPAVNVPVQEQRGDDSDYDEGASRICTRQSDMDEETCTTRAFAIPLPTSTPFSRPNESRAKRTSMCNNGSFISDENSHLSSNNAKARQKAQDFQQLIENSRKLNMNTPNLSLILENSKELGGFSSGSSGNAGSKVRYFVDMDN